MSGATFAQIIPIFVTPILTRLYTPSDFGVFAFYMGVVLIASVAITLRYEHVIIVTKSDDDANSAVVLVLVLVCVLSVVLFCIVSLGVMFIDVSSFYNGPKWLFYLLPISTLNIGVYQAFYAYLNRNQVYRALAVGVVIQTSVTAVVNIIFGVLDFGAVSLIVGTLLGQIASNGYLIFKIYKHCPDVLKWVPLPALKVIAKCHAKFPKFALPGGFLNVLTTQLPVLLFTNLWGVSIAGYYSLMQRVLGKPTAFLGRSISDVFRERASKDYATKGDCRDIYVKALKTLSCMSLPPALLLFVAAPVMFKYVFGSEWVVSGEYVRIMVPMFLTSFVASPLSYVLYITGKQNYDFYWQLARLLATIFSIALGLYFGAAKICILTLSILYSLLYLAYIVISYRLSNGERVSAVKRMRSGVEAINQ